MTQEELEIKVVQAYKAAINNDPGALLLGDELAKYIFLVQFCLYSPCNYITYKKYQEMSDENRLAYWKTKEPIYKISKSFKNLSPYIKLGMAVAEIQSGNNHNAVILGNAAERDFYHYDKLTYAEDLAYSKLNFNERVSFWKNNQFKKWNLDYSPAFWEKLKKDWNESFQTATELIIKPILNGASTIWEEVKKLPGEIIPSITNSFKPIIWLTGIGIVAYFVIKARK